MSLLPLFDKKSITSFSVTAPLLSCPDIVPLVLPSRAGTPGRTASLATRCWPSLALVLVLLPLRRFSLPPFPRLPAPPRRFVDLDLERPDVPLRLPPDICLPLRGTLAPALFGASSICRFRRDFCFGVEGASSSPLRDMEPSLLSSISSSSRRGERGPPKLMLPLKSFSTLSFRALGVSTDLWSALCLVLWRVE